MKKGVLIVFAFAFVFASLSFASAAVTIFGPLNGTNYSATNGGFIFNVSWVNGTDLSFTGDFVAANLNASIYSQTGTTITSLGNSSTCGYTLASQIIACWGPINVTSANDGFFNLTAQVFNETSASVNSSLNLTSIYFDSTTPESYAANLTGPTAGTNQTGSLTINVSLADATIGIETVIFNITNATGSQNATYTATSEGSSRWSFGINTTDFPDGTYNITINVNDTLGNLNSTAALALGFVMDNSNPSVSVSCSPTSVTTGESVTCTCTTSDTHSGVDADLTSNPTPSTSNTGTITQTCSATNFAGLSTSASTTFVVEQTAGSAGGSGGSGSSGTTTTTWKTYTSNQADFESSEGYDRSLSKNQRVKVDVAGEDHTVGVKSIVDGKVTVEVASEVQTAEMSVGETKKFEVTGDNLYDVEVTLNSITGTKADLTIKQISEEKPSDSGSEGSDSGEDSGSDEFVDKPSDEVPEDDSSGSGKTIGIILALIIVLGIVWFIKKRK